MVTEPIVRRGLPVVLLQHAEDAAILRTTRSILVRAPHVRLHQLLRHDDRMAAHIDGLVVAGRDGLKPAVEAMASPDRGSVFVLALLAIVSGQQHTLERVLALVQAEPQLRRGLVSAFGWVSSQHLTGTVFALLQSPDPFRRRLGLAVCGVHRVDPGPVLVSALDADDPAMRADALRLAGRLGLVAHRDACLVATADADAHVRYEAAHAAALLGDRTRSLTTLLHVARSAGVHRWDALWWLRTGRSGQYPEPLRELATDAGNHRAWVHGVGLAGDPCAVPWLIDRMDDPGLARLAGGAVRRITGIDLAAMDLEGDVSTHALTTDDDAPGGGIGLDRDDSMPWPDARKVAGWWSNNADRFVAGRRYFLGREPSSEHCLAVLQTGFQTDRNAAAEERSLQCPGTVLFNTAAPAWRQRHILSAAS